MEEAQGKKKRLLQNLRDKPITQEQLAALLDVTPRAINEMRKRGVLPKPTTATRLRGLTVRRWPRNFVRSACSVSSSPFRSSGVRYDADER